MTYFESELVERAVASHIRYARRLGGVPMQPARDACVQRGRTIIVANSYGVLARYRVTGRRGAERLRRIS